MINDAESTIIFTISHVRLALFAYILTAQYGEIISSHNAGTPHPMIFPNCIAHLLAACAHTDIVAVHIVPDHPCGVVA
jgi:carbonic anhydrase